MATGTSNRSWTARQAGRLRRHWPWLLIALVVCAGLGAMAAHYWRKGIFIVGCAGVLGALLRAVLPSRRVQLLVVRSRMFDVATFATLGVAIVAMSFAIPAIPR
jgi:hypothetical protein